MSKKSTETKILEAAKSIFIQKGFAGARMQEIADKAQINKAMLHYYFKNKRALFEGIVASNIQLMAPKMLDALSGENSVYEKLCKLTDAYIETIIKNPDMPMFLIHELSQGHLDSVDKMKAILKDDNSLMHFLMQIQEEQEAGILKPIPAPHIMLSAMSLIVFPFIARPIFETMLEIPSEFYVQMMQQRKQIVKDILKASFVN